QPLDAFGAFFKAVGDQIQEEGGSLGPPKPFQEPGLPRFWPMLIALAAFPVVWWVVATFVSNRTARIVGGAALGALAVAAWTHTGSQVAAFLIACSFMVAGYL